MRTSFYEPDWQRPVISKDKRKISKQELFFCNKKETEMFKLLLFFRKKNYLFKLKSMNSQDLKDRKTNFALKSIGSEEKRKDSIKKTINYELDFLLSVKSKNFLLKTSTRFPFIQAKSKDLRVH